MNHYKEGIRLRFRVGKSTIFRTYKKTCFSKVVKRRATKEPLNSEFLDEINLTVVVNK